MLCCLPLELWDLIYNILITCNQLKPIAFSDPWNGTYIRYKTWLLRATKIVIVGQTSKTLNEQINEYLLLYPDKLVTLLQNECNKYSRTRLIPELSRLIFIKKNILQVYFRDVNFRLIEIMAELYSSYSEIYGDCDMNTTINICLPYSDTHVNRSFWIPTESWEYRDAILEYQIKKILNIT